jgi:hypothetical protein
MLTPIEYVVKSINMMHTADELKAKPISIFPVTWDSTLMGTFSPPELFI